MIGLFDHVSYSSIIYFNPRGCPLLVFPIHPVDGRSLFNNTLNTNHETTYRSFQQEIDKKKDKINQNQRNVGLIPNEKE